MAEQAELTRSNTRERLHTVNPATGQPGKSYDQHSIDDARSAAAAPSIPWAKCRGCSAWATMTRPT